MQSVNRSIESPLGTSIGRLTTIFDSINRQRNDLMNFKKEAPRGGGGQSDEYLKAAGDTHAQCVVINMKKKGRWN